MSFNYVMNVRLNTLIEKAPTENLLLLRNMMMTYMKDLQNMVQVAHAFNDGTIDLAHFKHIYILMSVAHRKLLNNDMIGFNWCITHLQLLFNPVGVIY